jgi:hypothetical protein
MGCEAFSTMTLSDTNCSVCLLVVAAAAVAACGHVQRQEPPGIIMVTCGFSSEDPQQSSGKIEGKLVSLEGIVLDKLEADRSGYSYDFVLSPDGDRVLYCRVNAEGRKTTLELRELTNPKTITVASSTRPHILSNPSWSPSGGKIAVGFVDFKAKPVAGSLRIFDVENLTVVKTIEHAVPVNWLSEKTLVVQVPSAGFALLDLDTGSQSSIDFEGPIIGTISDLGLLVGVLRQGNLRQIYLIDAESGSKRYLAEVKAFSVEGAQWHAPSREIIFTKDKNPGLFAFDSTSVAAINIDSGEEREVLSDCVTSGGFGQSWMIDTLFRLHYEED